MGAAASCIGHWQGVCPGQDGPQGEDGCQQGGEHQDSNLILAHQSLPKPLGRSTPSASSAMVLASSMALSNMSPSRSMLQTSSSFSPRAELAKFSGRLSFHSEYSSCTALSSSRASAYC